MKKNTLFAILSLVFLPLALTSCFGPSDKDDKHLNVTVNEYEHCTVSWATRDSSKEPVVVEGTTFKIEKDYLNYVYFNADPGYLWRSHSSYAKNISIATIPSKATETNLINLLTIIIPH